MDESEFASLGFSVGNDVNISDNGFWIGNVYFSLQDVKIEKTELAPISAELEFELCLMIFQALRLSPNNTVFYDLLLNGEKYLSSTPAVYARDIPEHSKEHLCRWEATSAAVHLTNLIGLGTGLTPSGDDFLCGALAALTMRSTSSELLSALRMKTLQKLNLTNDISAEFLRCACDGHFSLCLTELPYASSAKDIALSFSRIGHSSGADTLNGILFIFSQTDRQA